MKNLIYIPLLILSMISCSSEPSLQKYMAKNSEDVNFIALDLGADILKLKQDELSQEEKEALNSIKKLNILAFKKTEDNDVLYQKEKTEVQVILKENAKYEQLMSFGSGAQGASVYAVGEGEEFDEFVIFGNQKETGFAIIRLIGKDMTVNHLLRFQSILDKADIDKDQLKPLEAFITKKEEHSAPEETESTQEKI